MANTSWINKILYKKQGSTTGEEFPIGTTFDKVYSDLSRTFSLENLADTLKTFFSRPAFMIYSTRMPANNSKIVEFYSITTEGDNPVIDSNFINKA